MIGCRPKRETALPPTQSELRASYNLTMLNLYVSCSSVAPPPSPSLARQINTQVSQCPCLPSVRALYQKHSGDRSPSPIASLRLVV